MIETIGNAMLYRAEYRGKRKKFQTKSNAITWLANQILRWTLTHDKNGLETHSWVQYDKKFVRDVRFFLKMNKEEQIEQWIRDHEEEYIWSYDDTPDDDYAGY